MRRLVLARHAQAQDSGDSDLTRELTSRGLRDAAAAGRWLAGSGVTPERALCSPAHRTQQTLAAMIQAGGWPLPVTVEPALYTAGAESVFDLLRDSPAELATLLVVGHNPTVSLVAQLLDDAEGDPAALSAMNTGFPPAALAVFEVADGWAGIGPGAGRLTAFEVGRG